MRLSFIHRGCTKKKNNSKKDNNIQNKMNRKIYCSEFFKPVSIDETIYKNEIKSNHKNISERYFSTGFKGSIAMS